VTDVDELGRRHAARVHVALADVEPPPIDLVTQFPRVRHSRGAWVALAAAVAVAALLIPVALLEGGRTAPNQTGSVVGTTTPAASTTSNPESSLSPFDLDSFATGKLSGAFDPDADRIGVVVLAHSSVESDVELLLGDFPELEGYSYVPADMVRTAADLFAEAQNMRPLEGEWVAYGLIPQLDDSPTSDWVASLRSIPDSVAVRVDFNVPVDQIPEGWSVIADLPIDIASGAIVEAVDVGIAVVQPGSTLLVGFDGSLTSGEEPPLPMTAECCGGEDGVPNRNGLLLIDEATTGSWVLETDTMTWRQVDSRPSPGYVLGSALIGDELVIVTAAARTGGAVSSVAALDVSTGVWREPEPVPSPVSVGGVTTDGDRLIVAGTQQGPNNNVIGGRNPVAYQYTDADGWIQLPDVPIDGQASTVTWVDGAGLLAWNYDLESALLEPSGSWVELDAVPMDFMECHPQSVSMATGAVGLCGGIAWFEGAAQSWTSIRQIFDTRYVVSQDAIYGLVQTGRDQIRLIQHPLPPR